MATQLGEGTQITWKYDQIFHCAENYERLLRLLTNDLAFTSFLSHQIDATDVDAFSPLIVGIFNGAQKTESLVYALLDHEFSQASNESKGALLRGNNVLSKIENAFVRTIGTEYLQEMLTEPIENLLKLKESMLEIDPRKLKESGHFSDIEGALDKNRMTLLSQAQKFLDVITDQKNVEKMPIEIRKIARAVYTRALKGLSLKRGDSTAAILNETEALALVGGFILLRYISPAIVTPERWGLLSSLSTSMKRQSYFGGKSTGSSSFIVTPERRRNLILVTKILQNASNGVEFAGGKEDYMLPLNCFITENRSKINQYLKKVCMIDSPEAQAEIDKAALASLTNPEPKEFADFPYLNSCVQDCSEMFELHRILDHCMHRLIPNILRLKKARNLNPKTTKETFLLKEDDVIGILQGLGSSPRSTKSFYFIQNQEGANRVPSPDASTTSTSNPTPQDKRRGLQSRFLSFTADAQEAIASMKKSSLDVLGGSSPRTGSTSHEKPEPTTKDISSQKVFYVGSPNKKGEPVVYVVLDRLKEENLSSGFTGFVQEAFKVMEPVVQQGKYSILVDCSWDWISNNTKTNIYLNISKWLQMAGRQYRKNLSQVYIVHPNAFTSTLLTLILSVSSKKLSEKIFQIYNWKDLSIYIDPQNITLPQASKEFITKTHKVKKVNAKGKKQERLIKFTQTSFLNIEPLSGAVKNEKSIEEIAEISTGSKSTELLLHFKKPNDTFWISKKSPFLTDAQDLLFRKYVCQDLSHKDDIIEDIFRTAFNFAVFYKRGILPQEYHVVKINQAKKMQERVFKITMDSILNLEKDTIKSEFSFGGIEEIFLDQVAQDLICMRMRGETYTRQIICKGFAKLLVQAVKNGIECFNRLEKTDEALELFGILAFASHHPL